MPLSLCRCKCYRDGDTGALRRRHMARSVLVRCLESPLYEGYDDADGAHAAPLYALYSLCRARYSGRVCAR